MEMRQIRYFLAVARAMNFTRAAEECHVAQPSLSRAIHLLEEELGGELLRRERSLSHLTELGQRMLPILQQCYDNAALAKSMARMVATGETASVAIAVSRTIHAALLAAPLAELSRAFPNVEVKLKRIEPEETLELLKRGEAEFAIAGSLGNGWERLDSWPLFSEPFELVVSRECRLARRKAVGLDQLAHERFLVRAHCEMAEELSRRLNGSGLAAAGAFHVTSDYDLVALLEANFGIAIAPASAIHSSRLRHVPVSGLDLTRTVTLYAVAGRRRSNAAATLLNLLRASEWPPRPHYDLSAAMRSSISIRRR